ncbi:GNAT family N-acetyltransferase [Vibrio paucivorans]|uniref:GNAT family N-acetyltransferase n=1 Tax=Vibrio paucivorans TaxID=2829489 RepID=A0A9X3HRP0_9VIBR|nr:GNAT family N-acetyltransferase [Vibrio paucivorans]MCW8334138.1 GNAT family N-acetyltransferase [Vibrio paucivorans]
MQFGTRLANDNDYQFAYEVKIAAEVDAITAVFGWDEELQVELHRQEWNTGKPTIITHNDCSIGTFMLEEKGDCWFFSRFFIFPKYQNHGIGSAILQQVIEQVSLSEKPCKLCYLQGNKVRSLYERFGFTITEQDSQYVHMIYPKLQEKE